MEVHYDGNKKEEDREGASQSHRDELRSFLVAEQEVDWLDGDDQVLLAEQQLLGKAGRCQTCETHVAYPSCSDCQDTGYVYWITSRAFLSWPVALAFARRNKGFPRDVAEFEHRRMDERQLEFLERAARKGKDV